MDTETALITIKKTLGRILAGAVKFSNIILFILLFLFAGILVGIILIDRYVTDSFFTGQIINILIENKLAVWLFSPAQWLIKHSIANMLGFLLICTVLLLLKSFFKRVVYKKQRGTWRVIIASFANLLVNFAILIILFVVFVNIIVAGYVTNTYDSIVSGDGGKYEYADMVNQIEMHLNDTKAAASLALGKLMFDVNYSRDIPENLSDDEYRELALELCALIELKGSVDNAEEHYFRNNFSRAPKTLSGMIETITSSEDNKFGWKLMPPDQSLLHMYGPDGEYNLKFISSDGYFEAVYNRAGELLTEENDPVNMGTFNYADPVSAPGKHSVYDVLPYFVWNNTEEVLRMYSDGMGEPQDYYANEDAQERYNRYRAFSEN
ncbi:hypothetical protein [Breznakiella homolactica]|uniref:Uncharacterized protein n=1 Tax=Breznakiella homolactica TaxID=2798577 RepID=A0A7T8B9Q3_9SPIR|nr:hypothetical protein [Breznakiella homolactica]QQO08717.1 hypothetical protein JFL75_17590 [Breznakiella homolactica]